MKQALFIDANIYLRFYDSNSKEFKKLLTSIEEVKDSIFITKQIQDEVERNKLDVFLRSFAGYGKQFGLVDVTLPEHLEASTDKEIKEWNILTSDLSKRIKDQRKKLKEITEKLIEDILQGRDEVSQVLSKAFKTSLAANSDQKERARIRKEVGNPPGKVGDPLGDQLTWEQLLDGTSELQEIWIISNDGDYLNEFDKKRYLNAFLNQELICRNKNIRINCFDTLSEGFASFNKSKKIANLPKEVDLGKIIDEEKESNRIQQYLYGTTGATVFPGHSSIAFPSSSGVFASFFPKKCDECGRQEHSMLQGATSVYWQPRFHTCPQCKRYLCNDCWPHFDTMTGSSTMTMNFGLTKCPRCNAGQK